MELNGGACVFGFDVNVEATLRAISCFLECKLHQVQLWRGLFINGIDFAESKMSQLRFLTFRR